MLKERASARVVSTSGQSILYEEITICSNCPRLASYRKQVALKYAHLYPGQKFWAKPVPGYGDINARLVIVGLAPAARGGNRTGRVFTGDESGNNLARALYQAGLANQPYSLHRDDGLRLNSVYITAAVKCVPPDNRPNQKEIINCLNFLVEEILLLRKARVFLALGRIAWNSLTNAVNKALGTPGWNPPRFKHGIVERTQTVKKGVIHLIASYHPSPRNVRTGLLSIEELTNILRKASTLAGIPPVQRK